MTFGDFGVRTRTERSASSAHSYRLNQRVNQRGYIVAGAIYSGRPGVPLVQFWYTRTSFSERGSSERHRSRESSLEAERGIEKWSEAKLIIFNKHKLVLPIALVRSLIWLQVHRIYRIGLVIQMQIRHSKFEGRSKRRWSDSFKNWLENFARSPLKKANYSERKVSYLFGFANHFFEFKLWTSNWIQFATVRKLQIEGYNL